MGNTPTTPTVFVGIDVSKAALDVVIRPTGEYFQVPNSASGRSQLLKRLEPFAVGCIVLEATGGYEHPCVATLVEAQLPIAVINPKRARDLARGLGILAKNDLIDASVLSYCAEHCKVPKAVKTPEKQVQLEALVLRRRQLVDMRAIEQTRLDQVTVTQTKKDIRQMLTCLDKHVEKIEKQIAELIDSDDHWSELARIIDSAPGIGPTTAAIILAELPELGSLNRQEIGALVGVVPYHKDSGKRKGKRSIYGGRENLRCSLYMATLTATTKNPVIKTFYQRLTAAGKPFKVRMIACIRKLLSILNQMVKNRQHWNENLPKCA